MKFLKGVERSVKRIAPQSLRKYFRASKYELLMERSAPVDLIVHVGAHWGEDAEFYEKCGAKTVLWIEADPDTYAKLTDVLAQRNGGTTRHLCENALVSAQDDQVLTFHRFNGDGASSSVYQATQTTRDRFSHVRETGEVLELPTRTLPEIMRIHGIDPTQALRSMLVLDVQGHELAILTGLGPLLAQFDLCKCEVSRVPMYEGGAVFEDIDAHMKSHDFSLKSHRYALVPSHGDVLYIKGT